MKTNIDRSLRLVTKDQNEKTYDWAIIEVDDEGQQSSPELKPWRWTLGFTATEISVISETVVNEERERSDDYARQREEIHHGQRINAKLVPESSDDFFHPREATTCRMFGTDRVIKNFDLEIIPLENEDEKESCYAVGYPSYTAEIDFVNEYFSDYVSFVIKVKPSTFSQYINLVASGANNLDFRVGDVSGFYSEWSPGISTDNIKIFTAGGAHSIEQTEAVDIKIPSLGPVGKSNLRIFTRKSLVEITTVTNSAPSSDLNDIPDRSIAQNAPQTSGAPNQAGVDLAKSVNSVKRWTISLLIILILVVLLK